MKALELSRTWAGLAALVSWGHLAWVEGALGQATCTSLASVQSWWLTKLSTWTLRDLRHLTLNGNNAGQTT